MTSARIKGRKLALKIGTPATDVWQDITTYSLTPEDLDGPTFGDIADGAAQWKLSGSAIQSTASDSFWAWVWSNAGETVAFTLAPHGNAVPSTAQPHYVGMVSIGHKPSLGGDAGSSGYTFDFEWEVEGEPTQVTAATP
jgi:hypothetical protein